MSKRSTAESIDKLRGLVEGNAGISVQLQTKLLKQVNQISKRAKPAEAKEKRPPGSSQFEKPLPISQQMAEFAGWEPGSLKSRVQVTKAVWGYAIEKELRRDEKNKRVCYLDNTLKALLGTDEATITYPQIQKYIGKHFLKA
jgi:chromatin remodeling complex protein RSC6